MVKVNDRFETLPESYLFSETAKRAKAWQKNNPRKRLIRLGIGDVTLPLTEAAVQAMVQAAKELKYADTFRGYGPEQGYEFLREIISNEDYAARGVRISPDEIFISDGIKTDCGAILELFDRDNIIGFCDPVYPAYMDAAVISGYAGDVDRGIGQWSKLLYLPCRVEYGFIPAVPQTRADIVYLCFPNNPTGAAATREQLAEWVRWANTAGSVLLFDGAYEAFITDSKVPHSIYEIDGAEACAIEFRSFSKTAGFTGVRCGYTVIPEALKRNGANLHQMWRRRLSGRSNGVSYIVQRGAQAVYSAEGREQIRERIVYYHKNAEIISRGLKNIGLTVYGGENAPYVWVKTPHGQDSWTFFDVLLHECGILTTPGVGFGPSGEGYLRLTAFGNRNDAEEAIERMKNTI